MKRKRVLLTILTMIATFIAILATPREIVVHTGGGSPGYNQSSYPPPEVTFDDETNTLYVYFNFGGYLTLTCTDSTGYTYNVVYHQSYTTGSTATVYNLLPGYYEIEIDCGFAGFYTGNFSVY